MKNVKCRTCGVEHRLGPCPSNEQAAKPTRSTAVVDLIKPLRHKPLGAEKCQEGVEPSTPSKFDRVAYQRNYMRLYRARQKAAKGEA